MDQLKKILFVILPPILTFVLFVILWHVGVKVFHLKPFQVPLPSAVWEEATKDENFSRLIQATWLTAFASIVGFLISVTLGFLIAIFFSQSKIIQRSFYPYAIFFQTVPIIAIAPLIITWFGPEIQSIIIIVTIISLFPIITNTTTGLTDLDPSMVELFEVHRATRIQKMIKLQIPNAIPHLITGARTSSGLSVIGAIIGELFGSHGKDKYGLGYLIFLTSNQLRLDFMFAAIIASTILGLIIFGSTTLIGRFILRRWKDT